MQNHSGYSIKSVPVKKINLEDRFYSISPFPFNEEKLLNTIKIAGMTVPVLLEPAPENLFRIVSGFKRTSAAVEAGMAEIPAVVRETGDRLGAFWTAVQENYGSRELHALENAEIIRKLKELHCVEEKDLLSSYLPGLGLRGSRYELDRFLALAGLSELLKKSCLLDNLLCSTALEIRAWPEAEQVFFASLCSQLQLGTNKQKQLVRLIEDLKKKELASLESIWEKSGLQGTEPGELNFEKIHYSLSQMRFPVLSSHQERFKKLKENLHLGQGIKLQVPRYFDGDSVSVAFSAADISEFREKSEQLMEASGREELEEIFKLL